MQKILLPLVLMLLSLSGRGQSLQWNSLGYPGFSAGNALTTNMAIDKNGIPYVVYQDGVNGPATVMEYIGNQWVAVGNTGFSGGAAGFTSITLNSEGTPYVAYVDGAHDSRVTVMKYSGNQWVAVGSPGFSKSAAQYTSIAISNQGTPYVVFQDADSGMQKATVMEYNSDSSKWIVMGKRSFSSSVAQYTSITINRDGVPFVAYEDGAYGPATVMVYDGNNWIPFGKPGFSAGRAKYTTIVTDRAGYPYVAYLDAGNASKATVMTYSYGDTSWRVVGKAGFSAGQAYYISLALDGNDIPYVAYADNSDSNKATVMKYDAYTDPDWQTVGTVGFSSAWAWSTSIAIDGAGIPYIAYSDLGYDNKATVMKLGTVAAGVKNTVAAQTTSLSLFPSPNRGLFTARISSLQSEKTKMIITNLLGEKVKELTVTTNTDLKIQLDNSPGIYFISAMTTDGNVSGKVVIE